MSLTLEARNLSRQSPHKDHWLLRNVSLTLHAGERLALLGASGSGKTLLLRSLAFLDPLDEGELLWNGNPVIDVPRYRRSVSYLHQRSPLFEGTVEDNLRAPFHLSIRQDQTFDRARISQILTRLERDESFLKKSHQDLSGGEAQITTLLRTLQLDPNVLLLDEPTSALDSTTTLAVESLILDWVNEKKDERALVWVSHEQSQSKRMCDHVLKMDAGQIHEGES